MKNLLIEMKNCEQIVGSQNILQHGSSVYRFFKDVFENKKYHWNLPDWFWENSNFIKENIHTDKVIKKYCIFHDCGKPKSLSIDEFG